MPSGPPNDRTNENIMANDIISNPTPSISDDTNTSHFLVWSEWANNAAGVDQDPLVFTASLDRIVCREQDGFGVVNIGLVIGNDTVWTARNNGGVVKKSKLIGPGDAIVEVVVREQYRYGVIDIGVRTRNSAEVEWLTKNPAGGGEKSLKTKELRALQGRYQSGYGIVDLRIAGIR